MKMDIVGTETHSLLLLICFHTKMYSVSPTVSISFLKTLTFMLSLK